MPLHPTHEGSASAMYQLHNHVWCAGWSTLVQTHCPLSPALLQSASEVSASVLALLTLQTIYLLLLPSCLLELGPLISSSPALSMETIVIFFFIIEVQLLYNII